jgi:hypothetical protein
MENEIAIATFNNALEMCDEIQRMSKIVGDPIAYVESDYCGTADVVVLLESTLSDGSKVYSFRLEESQRT